MYLNISSGKLKATLELIFITCVIVQITLILKLCDATDNATATDATGNATATDATGNATATDATVLNDAPISITCPYPEVELNTAAGKFVIMRRKLNWKDAHDICEREKGVMATFENEQDARDLVEAIFALSYYDQAYDAGKKICEFGLDRRYWIGLTDLSEEGKWRWVGSGQALAYTSMWTRNQPDHINPDGSVRSGRLQHCVSLWNPAYWKHDGHWKKLKRHTFDDLECDRKNYFICKEDSGKLSQRQGASASGGSGGGGGAEIQTNCPDSQPVSACT